MLQFKKVKTYKLYLIRPIKIFKYSFFLTLFCNNSEPRKKNIFKTIIFNKSPGITLGPLGGDLNIITLIY